MQILQILLKVDTEWYGSARPTRPTQLRPSGFQDLSSQVAVRCSKYSSEQSVNCSIGRCIPPVTRADPASRYIATPSCLAVCSSYQWLPSVRISSNFILLLESNSFDCLPGLPLPFHISPDHISAQQGAEKSVQYLRLSGHPVKLPQALPTRPYQAPASKVEKDAVDASVDACGRMLPVKWLLCWKCWQSVLKFPILDLVAPMERNACKNQMRETSELVHLLASWDPPGRQSASVVAVARTSFSPYLQLTFTERLVKLSAWLRIVKCWFRGGSGQGHICRQIARRMPGRSTKFAAHYGYAAMQLCNIFKPRTLDSTTNISHHMIRVEVLVLTTWYGITIQIHALMKNQSEEFLVQSWRKVNR